MEICVLTPLDLEKFAHLFPSYLLRELPGDALLLGCVEPEPLEAAGVLLGHVEEDEIIVDWLYVDEPFRTNRRQLYHNDCRLFLFRDILCYEPGDNWCIIILWFTTTLTRYCL